MKIAFRRRQLENTFNSQTALRVRYGEQMANAIGNRMAVLSSARTLSLVPSTKPERCHRLSGRRRHQFAVDLVHPYRLLFELADDPIPLRADGGIDKDAVTAITIIEVIDYH